MNLRFPHKQKRNRLSIAQIRIKRYICTLLHDLCIKQTRKYGKKFLSKKNWDFDALTDYKGATLQYKDLARKIEKLHILLEESGVRPGDKVAICGRNSSHWGVAFLATLTYGAIAVPILHEFKADTIHNIVNHSDARLLFVGDMAWESLNEAEMPALEGIILMTDFTLLVC